MIKPLTQTYCSRLFRLLALLALFPTSWSYAEDESPMAVIVQTPYISVHTGPGRGYPVFHVIEQGERIELIKKRTEWIKIKTYRGKTGWVFREELRDTIGDNGAAFELTDYSIDGFKNRRWELGFGLGDFGGADIIGIELGYRFTPNFTAEARLSQIVGNFSDSTLATVNITHQPFPTWRLSPYFMLGAGKINISPDSTIVLTEDRNNNVVQVGVGSYFYLTRRFVLRLEYTNNLLLTQRDENEEINQWKLGVTAFF